MTAWPSPLEVSGAVLAVAFAAWTWASTGFAGPLPPTGLLALTIMATVLVARHIAARTPLVVPSLVVVGALAVVIVDLEVLLASPFGPFGYANAAAAFFVVAAGAGVVLARELPAGPTRATALAVAVGFAVIPWLNGALAAAAGTIALLLTRLGWRSVRAHHWLVVASATAAAVTILATALLGATHDNDPGPVERVAVAALSDRRLDLWHDAVAIIATRPLVGVGRGGFAIVSPTARGDADAAWAHNEFLQVGAETGLPGLFGMVAILLWAFFVVARSRDRQAGSIAAVLLAVAAMHASIDYVWHAAAVPLALAAVVGATSPAPRTPLAHRPVSRQGRRGQSIPRRTATRR